MKKFFLVLIIYVFLISCVKKNEESVLKVVQNEEHSNNNFTTEIDALEDNNIENIFLPGIETISEERNIVINFVVNEILNNNIYKSFIEDKNGVIDTYGTPISDKIIQYTDGLKYEGGMILIGIREILYDDLTHRYFVFEDRNNNEIQYYVDVSVSKKLERLKTINIGDSSEKIIEIFGNNYAFKENESIIYRVNEIELLKFNVIQNSIIKIEYIITTW